jgi:hypothetical protein
LSISGAEHQTVLTFSRQRYYSISKKKTFPKEGRRGRNRISIVSLQRTIHREFFENWIANRKSKYFKGAELETRGENVEAFFDGRL